MSESSGNSSNNNSTGPKPYKKRNNRRYRGNKPKPNTEGGENKNIPQAASSPNANPNKKKFSKNRRPKSLTPSRILQKYENLQEQYIQARSKFFELFGRGKEKQLEKVEKNYHTSLENLRKFETGLNEDWQKEVLDQKINAYPEDRQYTTEHNIAPVGDTVAHTGEFEDPHLLATQKNHQWTEDKEESTGTIEDYQRYKDGYIPN